MTTTRPGFQLADREASPSSWYETLGSVDHKVIGLRYFVTALVFLLLGGIEALVMRVQLSRPQAGLISAEAYAQLFSMHGITMMFLFALPVLSGFSNYLWPLVLGARDMALPRINALSYWLFLAGGLLLYSSIPLGLAPDNGWFAYLPLSSARYLPRAGIDFYTLTLVVLGVSTTIGAINFVVTFVRMRAPGMSIGRVPILIWGTLTASAAVLFAIPPLTAACLLLYLDRRAGTHFYDVGRGGKPLLWQQLFWIFGHPWVYIIVLPAMSMVSQIIPTFSRRPLVAYRYVAGSTIAVGVIGFLVWVHHMFATGMRMSVMAAFGAASLFIALPSAISVFAWVATVWLGRPVYRTPFLFMLGFIVTFVMGGVSGVMTGSVPFDWQLTDSYFVVGHMHYVLLGINLLPVIGATYYWFPKVRGRLMNEHAGRLSFWLMFIGFNVGFFPMHIVGMLGMPRRIYTYAPDMGWNGWNLLITVGAVIFALGLLVSLANVWWSWTHGEPAGENPWNASTLEWFVPSPPPPHNFAWIPHVVSRDPLWEGTDERRRSVLRSGPAFEHGHDALTTTARTATEIGVVAMPAHSLQPLYVAAATLVMAEGLLWGRWLLAVVGLLLVIAAVTAWMWPKQGSHAESISPPADAHPIGAWAMWLTIATEAALFAALFFAWFFLADGSDVWTQHAAPELWIPAGNTIILLLSSLVLHLGARRAARAHAGVARGAVACTLALGAVFVAIQLWEYTTLGASPTFDAYGSAFYLITGLHGAHVVAGLLMLTFVLVATGRRALSADDDRRTARIVARYWHFVDAVWLCVFAVVYVAPHLAR